MDSRISDAPPRRQAQMYSVAILVAAELMLDDVSYSLGVRFYCFVLLLLTWGTMRCDDLQNIDPRTCILSQLGLRFVIRRTTRRQDQENPSVPLMVSLHV